MPMPRRIFTEPRKNGPTFQLQVITDGREMVPLARAGNGAWFGR